MANKTDDKILKAFDQLIIKYGYRGTTTKQIAEAAGVNESTVFRHFATKKDILDTQLRLSMQNMEKIIADFQITDNLEDDILRMGVAYLKYIQNHKAIFLTGIRDSYQYPEIRDSIQQLPEQMMKLLVKRFNDEYGIKVDDETRRHLQTLFLVLFGRVTMKLTYPESKLLGSDRDFIDKNFRGVVHYCVQWIKENKG